MRSKQSDNTGNSKKENPDDGKQGTTRGRTKSSKPKSQITDEQLRKFFMGDTPTEKNSSVFNYEDLLETNPTKETEETKETVDTEESTETIPTLSKRISGKQRKKSFEEYRQVFLTVPKLEDRKPVFVSREIRDQLDEITRKLGGRKMSVSGFIENLARHHLDLYQDDIESWKKL